MRSEESREERLRQAGARKDLGRRPRPGADDRACGHRAEVRELLAALAGLAAQGRWDELVSLLTKPDILVAAWRADDELVRELWGKTEEASRHRLVDAHRPAWQHPDPRDPAALSVAELLIDMDHMDEAVLILDRLIEHRRQHGDREGLALCLDHRAHVHWSQDQRDRAEACLREEERICREMDDAEGVAAALNNIAILLEDKCQLDQAMSLYRQSEGIHRERSDWAGVANSLGNQARLLVDRCNPDQAMPLFAEAERLLRKLDSKEGLARGLGNQAEMLSDLGRNGEGLRLAREAYQLARSIRHGPLCRWLRELLWELGDIPTPGDEGTV